jgi:hypothetical protein
MEEFSIDFSQPLNSSQGEFFKTHQDTFTSQPDGNIINLQVGNKLVTGRKDGTRITARMIDIPQGWKPAVAQLPDDAFRAKPFHLPDHVQQRIQQKAKAESTPPPSTPVLPQKTQTDFSREAQPLPLPEPAPVMPQQAKSHQAKPISSDIFYSKPKTEQPSIAPTGEIPRVKTMSYVPQMEKKHSHILPKQPVEQPQIKNRNLSDTKPQTIQTPVEPLTIKREDLSDSAPIEKNTLVVLQSSPQQKNLSMHLSEIDIQPSPAPSGKLPDVYTPIQIDEDAYSTQQIHPDRDLPVAPSYTYEYSPVINVSVSQQPSFPESLPVASENSVERTESIEAQKDVPVKTELEELYIPEDQTPPVLAQEMPDSQHLESQIEEKLPDDEKQDEQHETLQTMIRTHKAAKESLFSFISDIKTNADKKPEHQNVKISIQEENMQIVRQFLTGAGAKLEKTMGTIRFSQKSPQNQMIEQYTIEKSGQISFIQCIQEQDTILLIAQPETFALITNRLQKYLKENIHADSDKITIAPEETLPDPSLTSGQSANIPPIVLFVYFCLLITLFPKSPGCRCDGICREKPVVHALPLYQKDLFPQIVF